MGRPSNMSITSTMGMVGDTITLSQDYQHK